MFLLGLDFFLIIISWMFLFNINFRPTDATLEMLPLAYAMYTSLFSRALGSPYVTPSGLTGFKTPTNKQTNCALGHMFQLVICVYICSLRFPLQLSVTNLGAFVSQSTDKDFQKI